MNRVVLYRILVITILIAGTLTILVTTAKMPNRENNGFTRSYIAKTLPPIQYKELNEGLSKISGASSSSIFLVGQSPKAILILNKNLQHKDTLLINVEIPPDRIVPFSVYVDTPMIYLHINNMKSAIYGRFPRQNLNKIEFKSNLFTKSVQISTSTCIIRGFNSNSDRQAFQKIDLLTGNILIEKEIIPGQSMLNSAATDGMLTYEPHSARVIFTEYLQNKFYCMDTNLNLLFRHKTIDTIANTSVVMKDIEQDNGTIKKVPSIARIRVNENCFTDTGNIYIVSGLRADNENIVDFNTHTIIDIYNISAGQYAGSIRLKKRESKFKSAIIQNDTLITLYEKEIAYYHLPKIQNNHKNTLSAEK